MEELNALDIILTFLKAIKKSRIDSEQIVKGFYNDTEFNICSAGYLLNQIIRELCVSSEHYLVSKKAKELWDKLTSDDINKYFVGRFIVCDRADNTEVSLYKGNSKISYKNIKVQKNQKILYNSIFHNEHIVTIKDIIDELLKIDNPTQESVSRILNKIYICRMLKSENSDIIVHKHRCSLDYKKILENEYANTKNKQKIEIYKDN